MSRTDTILIIDYQVCQNECFDKIAGLKKEVSIIVGGFYSINLQSNESNVTRLTDGNHVYCSPLPRVIWDKQGASRIR